MSLTKGLVKRIKTIKNKNMEKKNTPTCINEVFERILNKSEYENQTQMIKGLDIARSFFFRIKKGEDFLSDEKARKLAEMAELPIDYVLIMNNFEKCKDAEAKEAYRVLMLTIAHIRTKGR